MVAISRDTSAPDGIHATIYTDGSCPANPGPMGIGYHIDVAPEREGATGYRVEYGTRFSTGTNNQAEYLGLIFALREALRRGVTHASVFSDSLLIVNQVGGSWKCKDGLLKPLREEAAGLMKLFSEATLSHVPREENTAADILSKNPTDIEEHSPDLEINLKGKRVRKLSRFDAARIRWWWKTGRCQNEYRLARIFGGTPSHMGRIGRGEQYADVCVNDLPHGVNG